MDDTFVPPPRLAPSPPRPFVPLSRLLAAKGERGKGDRAGQEQGCRRLEVTSDDQVVSVPRPTVLGSTPTPYSESKIRKTASTRTKDNVRVEQVILSLFPVPSTSAG